MRLLADEPNISLSVGFIGLELAAQGESVLNAAFGQHAALGSKDLRCALESAKKLKVTLPGTQKSEELIEDVFLCGY